MQKDAAVTAGKELIVQYHFGIQKHNYVRNGLPLPRDFDVNPHEMFDEVEKGIDTGKTFGQWIDANCFLILSIGTPRSHFLWSAFKVKKARLITDGRLSGPGWILNPPVRLDGPDWDECERSTKNIIGFRQIDGLEYAHTLMNLSRDHRRPGVFDARTISFVNELAEHVDVNDLRFDRFASAIVTQAAAGVHDTAEAGRCVDAVAKLTKTLTSLGWDGPWLKPYKDAARKLKATSQADGQSSNTPLATCVSPEQVEVLRKRLAELTARDRQDSFRSELLVAYGGRCAITGYSGDSALEAAHIRPFSGPSSSTLKNGLLLRADVHRLYDRHLIAINPKTRRIHLSKLLQESEFYDLHNCKLRLPKFKEQHPAANALQERWLEFVALEKSGSRTSDDQIIPTA